MSSLTPDTAFEEAREKLPEILGRRKVPAAPAMAILDQLAGVVQAVDAETYESFAHLARQRIALRDQDDWPVLAVALALGCPIWTEDADFMNSRLCAQVLNTSTTARRNHRKRRQHG